MSALVYFDREGRWGETLVCEQRIRAGLQALGVVRGHAGDAVPAGSRLLRPRGDVEVFYFARRGGWAGLLCERGEWLALPEGLEAAGGAPVLPGQDAFIEQVLALLGEDADDA